SDPDVFARYPKSYGPEVTCLLIAAKSCSSMQTGPFEAESNNCRHSDRGGCMTRDWPSFVAKFGKAATAVASWVGTPWAFAAALAVIVVWGALGPRHHYSDTWQLVINTGTTIITFLMVFLIQNTQNRDA